MNDCMNCYSNGWSFLFTLLQSNCHSFNCFSNHATKHICIRHENLYYLKLDIYTMKWKGNADILFYYPGDDNWWLGTFGTIAKYTNGF